MLNRVLLDLGGQDWSKWNSVFFADVFKHEWCQDGRRWWTAAVLGVPEDPDAKQFSPHDEAIFTTALVLITCDERRVLPTYQKTRESEPDAGDVIDVKIKIQ